MAIAIKNDNNNTSKTVGKKIVRINWKITNGIINCPQNLRNVLNQGRCLYLLKFPFIETPPKKYDIYFPRINGQ